jgi:hypothetical protein
MTEQPLTGRAGRPWPVVVLAGATWLPCWAVLRDDTTGVGLTVWGLLIALTLAPLCIRDGRAFRRACQIIAALLLAIEFLVSIPTMLLALPYLLVLCPAGWVLLLAVWNTGPVTRTIIGIALAVIPFSVGFATL